MPEERAINPYNFITFGDGPTRKAREAWYDGETLTGWFDVSIKLKSPLIIPDASNYEPEYLDERKNEKNAHKKYKFFRLPNGKCAIPGSTLRGLIRGAYEAATDSCLPFLATDHPISQRTPLYAALKDRGLLEYDGKAWRLYRAKGNYIQTTRDEVKNGWFQGHRNGEKVCFSVDENGTVKLCDEGTEEGWLQFNIPVDSGNPYHVAILQKRETDPVWPDKNTPEEQEKSDELCVFFRTAVWDTVKHVYEKKEIVDPKTNQKRLDKRGRPKKYGNEWLDYLDDCILPTYCHENTAVDLVKPLENVRKHGDPCVIPCYYFIPSGMEPRRVYLSCSAVGRVRQRRKWEEIMGDHAPCKKQEELCPACALFGSVRDGGNAGRLTFSDAVQTFGDEPEERTLPILSTPRTSSFEFYLRKPHPDAKYWNFDYYGVKASYTVTKNGKTETVNYTKYRHLDHATPRGRKLYWHGKPLTSSKKTRMNSTMEAINSGGFTFRIRFDRITRAQLGDLLWCVTLGNNSETGKYCHKLGHGKPVGYGSVKLYVDAVHLRAVSPEKGFAVSDEPHDPSEFMDDAERSSALLPAQVEAIRTMADFNATKDKKVAYLTGYDNGGRETIYSWFQFNRENADVLHTLPEPTCENLDLPNKRERKYMKGDILEKATVSKVSFNNVEVFFTLPYSGSKGHCKMPQGKSLKVKDRAKIKILSYNDRFNNYEVEVLDK